MQESPYGICRKKNSADADEVEGQIYIGLHKSFIDVLLKHLTFCTGKRVDMVSRWCGSRHEVNGTIIGTMRRQPTGFAKQLSIFLVFRGNYTLQEESGLSVDLEMSMYPQL